MADFLLLAAPKGVSSGCLKSRRYGYENVDNICHSIAVVGNVWRAIDFFKAHKINERALQNLVRASVEYNQTNRTHSKF
jgi:hypothetical protein